MAHEKHLLLRAAGDYVPSTLPGEIWQNDIRLALVHGSVDSLGTLPNNWDPSATAIARTETDWDITGNWKTTVLGSDFNPDDYLNDQAAPAWTAFMAAAHLSNQDRLRTLELFPIGAPDGKAVPAPPYALGTPCRLEWTGSYPTGGESSTQLPPQNSIAVSWRTQQIGARGRGRIFLPATTSGALSGGHVSTGAADDITAAAVTFLEALAYTSASWNVIPIVTGAPYVGYGIINQVRVGSVMDTQRRRRNRLTEVYTSTNVTY
jgi:hypothetical protein